MSSLKNAALDFRLTCWETILSGQHVSTIHKFKLSNLQLTENLALFNITDSLKQSKPNCKPVIFHKYPDNEQLCPVQLVQVYLEKRTSLSSVAPYDFFLTHRRPHHPATKDTIAWWVKTVLHLSCVDIDIYKPHSCISDSTSHAKLAGVHWKIAYKLVNGILWLFYNLSWQGNWTDRFYYYSTLCRQYSECSAKFGLMLCISLLGICVRNNLLCYKLH